MKSHAPFRVVTRRKESSFFGCPHHKHDALATLVGLPHAEQTFARRIGVCSFLENDALGRDVFHTRHRSKCSAQCAHEPRGEPPPGRFGFS